MPAPAPFCPRCLASLPDSARAGCPSCGLAFVRTGALLDLLADGARETRAAEVEGFYSVSPFPGYAPGDDGRTLLDRSRAAPFLVALDAALPPDALVLDVGCGTAQLAAFVALAGPRRRVLAIDGCRASLERAEAFRARAGIANLQLVRADLFDLPVEPARFAHVISRGVVHHTPDPERAIGCVVRCLAPGGHLVLGFYETMARAFHRARRGLGKLRGGEPFHALDPILRRRDLDPEKKRIWIDDQYRHPLEHILPLPRVIEVLRGLGVTTLRTLPPTASGASLFDPAAPPTRAELRARRLGWMLAGPRDPDAGLVAVVGRRQPAT